MKNRVFTWSVEPVPTGRAGFPSRMRWRGALCILVFALWAIPTAAAEFAEWTNTNAAPLTSPGTLSQLSTGRDDFHVVPLGQSPLNSQPPVRHSASDVGGSTLNSQLSASTINNSTSPASASAVTLTGYVPDDKYKLRAGDRVAFQILEDREPAPRSIVVTDSGEIDVPYIGRVMASDKTCKTLSAEIKALLEKEYYHRATVVISLDAANKFLGRVYVLGQVRNQGAIDILVNENLTAGKAILRAGGFADFANKKKVKLVRSSPDGTKQTFELNMTAILEQGKTELDAVLQPDDFIIVPSRLINL